MPTARSEFVNALHGTWRLARMDPSGMALFERSERGFWHSFRAALVVYPAFLILLGLRLSDQEGPAGDLFRILLVETIGYVIAWTAFPLAMLSVARFLGREQRWLDFMIAYNWSQILQYAVFLGAAGLAESAFVPPALAAGIAGAATVAVILYEWFIARVALDVTGLPATLVVLVDLVLGVSISRIAELLH